MVLVALLTGMRMGELNALRWQDGGSRNLRDVNETERLLHDQELGVLCDPTGSGAIWSARAERGQSDQVRDPSRRRAPQLCADCRRRVSRGDAIYRGTR